MEKRGIVGLVAVLVIMASAFSYAQTSGEGMTLQDLVNEGTAYFGEANTLSPQDAYKKILTISDLMIIDVNEKFEYDKEHLKGAILIPRGLIEFKINRNDIFPDINKGKMPADKDAPMLLYCRFGARCLFTAVRLKKMGYTNIYTIKGGLEAWKAERLPLEQ
ncbi:MAG: rhodanese-like domain-containing protein [Candidatus Omnitrophica bacterium]|nr:rhodanese-like domain-containing protein [Candidatus Omnitrophota bacterium]